MKKASADYEYTVEGGTLCIIDLDKGGVSVTNDMENVLADIQSAEGLLDDLKVVYRDSDGIWDGVTGWPGRIGFTFLGTKTKEEAIEQMLALTGGAGKTQP